MSENAGKTGLAAEPPEGWLRAIVGSFGSGKSLFGMERFWEDYQDGYRFFVTNAPLHLDKCQEAMPEAKFVVATNEEIASWWNKWPRQSVFLIDEAQLIYKARKWQSLMNSDATLEEYISQIRKSGDRVYLITQRWADLPTFLRDRVQHVMNVFRVPLPMKVFARWQYQYDSGKVTRRLQWFPKFVPFAAVKRFGELYATRGLVGKQAQRDAAAFELPKRGGVPKWILWAGLGCMLGWMGWRNRPQSESSSKVAAVVAATQGANSFARPVVQSSKKKLEFVDGHYQSSVGDVLAVHDDTVLIGNAHGKLLELARDFRAEYRAVRSQVKASGGNQSGDASGDAGGTASGFGSGVRSDANVVLPGRSAY